MTPQKRRILLQVFQKVLAELNGREPENKVKFATLVYGVHAVSRLIIPLTKEFIAFVQQEQENLAKKNHIKSSSTPEGDNCRSIRLGGSKGWPIIAQAVRSGYM